MKAAVTILAFCVAALLALGLVMLYSASMAMVDKHTQSEMGAHYLMMQLVWCALGFVLCGVAAAIDYQWLKRTAWPVYVLALVLLAAVFAPHIGHASHGAHRWIEKFGFTLQPSEFAKLALVIILAWYGDVSQRQMHTFGRGVVLPGILVAVVLGLIFIEPDRGTTILLAAVVGSMLLVAGVQWKHILIPAVAGAAGLAASILHDPMRLNRIMAWRHPQEHLDGAALQAHQAMIGLGSGGWLGVGLGDGMQKYGYLPEIQTDFIFANIGEELGLVATLLVVIAFLLIAICGIWIALHSRDNFGLLLAFGITLLISFQAAINIGVVTSALPNKGLPLPFISYGGSNLLAMLAGVGLLFSVARHAPEREKVSKPVVEADDNPFAVRAA
ncbi:MAG TPA: putative lipid II flippase FtsW [Verrucomicrobiae bacterium]|nr:putative lipid II flippase FtsW [Verrucomicrobiae bacterium]